MKKYYYIGIGLIILYLLTRKGMANKTPVSVPASPSGDAEKKALDKILKEYGRETAIKVEKMFRWETAHFKSGGYKKTNGAGMEAVKKDFPWGWSRSMFNGVETDGLVRMIDSGGRDVQFIKFKTPYDGMKVLANFLQVRKLGSWYSLDQAKQKEYETKVLSITPKIVNAL